MLSNLTKHSSFAISWEPASLKLRRKQNGIQVHWPNVASKQGAATAHTSGPLLVMLMLYSPKPPLKPSTTIPYAIPAVTCICSIQPRSQRNSFAEGQQRLHTGEIQAAAMQTTAYRTDQLLCCLQICWIY